jgi:hypothetical protein
VVFATKPRQALAMIQRALDGGVGEVGVVAAAVVGPTQRRDPRLMDDGARSRRRATSRTEWTRSRNVAICRRSSSDR